MDSPGRGARRISRGGIPTPAPPHQPGGSDPPRRRIRPFQAGGGYPPLAAASDSGGVYPPRRCRGTCQNPISLSIFRELNQCMVLSKCYQ